MYDLLVIGGGPAGYLAAERAGEAGFSVALFEKRYLGGVCLNEGCIPSKTLLHSAKIYDYARYSEKYGVKSENVSLDHGVVLKRKEGRQDAGNRHQGKLTKYKVKIVEAEAVIKGRNGEILWYPQAERITQEENPDCNSVRCRLFRLLRA